MPAPLVRDACDTLYEWDYVISAKHVRPVTGGGICVHYHIVKANPGNQHAGIRYWIDEGHMESKDGDDK
jgi:hypothetical protein